MRKRYLVAYDVREPDRLRKTNKKMKGFGDPIQYSTFICELSAKEKILMVSALEDIIKTSEDSVMIIDLGPVGTEARKRIEYLGVVKKLSERTAVIV